MSAETEAQLAEALREAVELHAATAAVLQLISEHPGDLHAVFDGIAQQAARLCGADNGAILQRDGDELVQVSTSAPGNASHIGDRFPISSTIDFSRPFTVDDLDTTLGRAVPVPVRSLLSVPLFVDGAHYGQLNVSRTEVRPFEARHTPIMETFAAHAVVAVKTARNHTELREALDLQTATSEVLRLISANPGDLRAVFQGIVTQAALLCDAHSGSIQRIVGDELEFIALSTELGQYLIGSRLPRVLANADGPTYFTDLHAELDGPILSPARSLLTVPLTTADTEFGRLTVSRIVVRPFEERHGKILQAFAEQAAVAISNAGLFNDLDEALELQTATSEVLALISANPGDLDAVFAGIMERANALCAADASGVWRLDGDHLTIVSQSDPQWSHLVGTRIELWPGGVPTDVVFLDDISEWDDVVTGGALSGSVILVPLLSDDSTYGVLALARYTVRPFEPRHAAIVRAFAEQASIALANAGLFSALRETTDDLRDLNQHLAERVDDKVREVERLNTLRRFVSPQLAEAIASGAAGVLASHRREITVLFCDLRGFTSFAETAEPEEVMAVLREFHDAVGPMIFEHEGTIAQFTGDGMLVFFNDPVQLDDPAWNAVQLAVRMRDRTGELSETWRRRGHDLTLGIGVAIGFATCGEIGFEGRTEYTAIGTVVNLAARICGIASGAQILVTHRVHAAVETRVSATALGDHAFKGLTRPVPLFEIAALRPD